MYKIVKIRYTGETCGRWNFSTLQQAAQQAVKESKDGFTVTLYSKKSGFEGLYINGIFVSDKALRFA